MMHMFKFAFSNNSSAGYVFVWASSSSGAQKIMVRKHPNKLTGSGEWCDPDIETFVVTTEVNPD